MSAIEQAIDDVVMRSGLPGLTSTAVAKRAGVGPGTIYRYFTSRDDLLLSWEHRMRRRCMRELARAVTEAAAEHPRLEDAVRCVAQRLVRTLVDQACIGRVDVFAPTLDRKDRLRFVERTRALLSRLLIRGEGLCGRPLRELDLALRASVYAAFFTAYPVALGEPSVKTREAFAGQMADMITCALVHGRTAEQTGMPRSGGRL